MGGVSFVFLVILLALLGSQPKDARSSELVKSIMAGVVGMMFLGVAVPMLGSVLSLGAIGGIGYLVYKKIKRKREEDARRAEFEWRTRNFGPMNQAQGPYAQNRPQGPYAQNRAQYRNPNQAQYRNPNQTQYRNPNQTQYRNPNQAQYSYTQQSAQNMYTTLPTASKKRKKIVSAFNDKYSLNLTEEQIQSMVNSSYMSAVWKRELEAMNRRYETVHQWFQAPTGWLRVYMHAFHLQEITSDIQQQENIAVCAFETVFNYVETLEGMSLSQQIAQVNNYFLTSFDDISFMHAYRYLESKGLHHELKNKEPIHTGASDDVEDLVRKYETEQM